MKVVSVVFLLALAMAVLPLNAQKPATVEGTLVDGACYLKTNETGHKDCLKNGSPAGILTKDKKFYALIAPAGSLADHVGQTVRVSGKVTNGSVVPEKIEVSKNGKWEEVKLGAMM